MKIWTLNKTIPADVYALPSDGTRIYLGTTNIHRKQNHFYTQVHSALLGGTSYPGTAGGISGSILPETWGPDALYLF